MNDNDPIFAALARLRRAEAALEHDEVDDAGVQREHLAAVTAVANTVPTTIGGCLALMDHRLAEAKDEVGDGGSHDVLVQVGKALKSLPA
jgi:hypothetical protein